MHNVYRSDEDQTERVIELYSVNNTDLRDVSRFMLLYVLYSSYFRYRKVIGSQCFSYADKFLSLHHQSESSPVLST